MKGLTQLLHLESHDMICSFHSFSAAVMTYVQGWISPLAYTWLLDKSFLDHGFNPYMNACIASSVAIE